MKRSMMMLVLLGFGACAPATKTVPVNVHIEMNGEVTDEVVQMEVGPEDDETANLFHANLGAHDPIMKRVVQLPLCGWDKEKLFLGREGNIFVGDVWVAWNHKSASLSHGTIRADVARSGDLDPSVSPCQIVMTEELIAWSKLKECNRAERKLAFSFVKGGKTGGIFLVGYEGDDPRVQSTHMYGVSRVPIGEPFPPLGKWDHSCVAHFDDLMYQIHLLIDEPLLGVPPTEGTQQ